MSGDALFNGPPEQPRPGPVERLSPDRARTLRQRGLIDRGAHPLEFLGVLRHKGTIELEYARDDAPGRLFTCGTCVFRTLAGTGARTVGKCAWRRDPEQGMYPRWTGSAASDVRAWWPACTRYTPKARR